MALCDDDMSDQFKSNLSKKYEAKKNDENCGKIVRDKFKLMRLE